MISLNTLSPECNRKIKINFNGGDLSSDAGLLLIKESAAKIGFLKLIKNKFKTNDKSVRFHKDNKNLMQMIFQIISAYFQDDCADELISDPVFTAILEKDSLASQPTLSRFFNRMDEDTLIQFDDIDRSLRDIIYSIKRPEHVMIKSNIIMLFKEIPLSAISHETSVFTRLLPHLIKIKIDLGMRKLMDSFQGLLLIFYSVVRLNHFAFSG